MRGSIFGPGGKGKIGKEREKKEKIAKRNSEKRGALGPVRKIKK